MKGGTCFHHHQIFASYHKKRSHHKILKIYFHFILTLIFKWFMTLWKCSKLSRTSGFTTCFVKSPTLKGFGLDQGQLLNLVAPLVLSGIKDWSGIVAGNLAHMWAFLLLGVMVQFPHQFQVTKILQERNKKCNQTNPEFVTIISLTPLTPLDPTINMKVLQITFQGVLITRICYYIDGRAGNFKSTCPAGE